jgi:hypothetical protein
MAAWAFLGLVMVNEWLAAGVAGLIFVAGLVATLIGARRIGVSYDREEKVLELLAEEAMSAEELRASPGIDASWANVAIAALLDRGEILDKGGGVSKPNSQ